MKRGRGDIMDFNLFQIVPNYKRIDKGLWPSTKI